MSQSKNAKFGRTVCRIQLTPESKQKLTDLSKALGMTQLSISEKLIEWFAKRPVTVQGAVLGLYPQLIAADIASLLLKKGLGPAADAQPRKD